MPANAQASQANDANRTDQDSPFALLMAASAPKEDKPAREQKEVEKPANDQPAVQPAPQSRTESKPAAKAKPNQKAKPDEKTTAENDNQDKKEEAAVNTGAPATDVQTAQTNPPPQAVVPLIVMSDAATSAVTPDAVAQEEPIAAIDTAASLPQSAAKPAQDLAALTPKDAMPLTAPVAATAVAESAPQPQTQQTTAPQATISQVPASQVPVSQTPVSQTTVPETQAPQDGASQTAIPQVSAPAAVPQAMAPQTNAAENSKTQGTKEIVVQVAALQNPAKPADANQPGNTPAPETADASIKTDTAKPVVPAGQVENKDGKPDAPHPETRPEMAKADSAQPDIAQPAPVDAAAPKLPPQTQPASNTNIAVQGNAAPQSTTTPSVLPSIPQHVQVSAEAAKPNMPTLAVEIAAKSQSGAKQFDIRLDPPELGRVEVRLSIDAAGKASAHLSADQPQTLELLQKDAASLTRALREAGLNVSQDGLNFSLRQQSHDGNGAQQGQARHASRSMTLIATNSIEATQTSAAYRGDGRLDIRV
jgi:flagellar hook-length control protein FliK